MLDHNKLWQEFKEGIDGFNGHKLLKYLEMRSSILINDSQMATLHRSPIDVSLSPITEPIGWKNTPDGAKEFVLFTLGGRMQKSCLILQGDDGVYNKIAIYNSKDDVEPMVVLDKNVYIANVFDMIPQKDGNMEKIVRNMYALDIAEDGNFVRIWVSTALTCEDKTIFYPTWIHDELYDKFGPATGCSMLGGGDIDFITKCSIPQWWQAAKWQADSIKHMIHEHGVEVVFSHYHGPDMAGHSYMTYLKDRDWSVHSEKDILRCHEATYKMTDDYIGELLPLIDEGWTLLLFSDHSLICREGDYHFIGDNYGINTGILTQLGYTVMKKNDSREEVEIDWSKTRAVNQRSNSIFINLKGRDRFGIVDPADKYELEEQIITDLYGIKDPMTGKRIISLALHQKDANLLGLGGEYTSGDIIFFVHEDYVHDHGESLSTAEGHADTSVGPIFVAAGAGIKQGFKMKLFPREVDVAPTAAVLLGVRMPTECEGAPIYSILSEEL